MNKPHQNAPEPTRERAPLEGVTVLDLGQAYQGPYAGLLLAKAGANVIRIEPLHGDSTRQRAKVRLGALFPYAMLNANKRSITLNLKSPEGCALLVEMVSKADVLIENFAPGVMDRLGVGWDRLRQVNPRLVYGSGTGFGLTGPDRDRLAMDSIVQAYSGVMSVTGFPGGDPLKAGIAVADFMGGVHLYGGIVTALYERHHTGEGRLVEVAMQEAVYPAMASSLGLIQEDPTGVVQTRTGNHHSGLSVSPWSVYKAIDGHIAIVCVKEAHWQQLTIVMGQSELQEDSRFLTNADRCENMDAIDAIIEQWTERHTREHIVNLANRHRFPAAPVRTLAEVQNDRGMHERGMLERMKHPELGETVLPSSPIRIHGTGRPEAIPSPKLGQHLEEVYCGWLGIAKEELDLLVRKGVI